jgi:hypothetical protein
VGGVTDCPIELRKKLDNLTEHVLALQSSVFGLEQDRLADACQIDRQAIQIQILRVDLASAHQIIKRQAVALTALTAIVNGTQG